MSKGNININISGGNSEFGNINQGDNANLDYERITPPDSERLEVFYAAVKDICKANNISLKQFESLKKEVETLTQKSESPDLISKVKSLYEKYSWAIEPIKKLFNLVVT